MTEPFPRSHFRSGAFPSRHYNRAPIIEAIISLDIEMPVGFEVGTLRHFVENTDLRYVAAGEEREMSVTASGAGIQSRESIVSGFRFISGDGKHSLICRVSSFSLSRLVPYENWETFRDEARRLWNLFRLAYGSPKVTGLSVRYINRIEIPLRSGEQIDFKWYFRTFPEVSSDLDVGMAGFYMRMDIPLLSIDARLILNQAMLPAASPEPDSVSVLLDADIISGSGAVSEEEIWTRYDVLRTAKNDVFEACITNLTRELFE